MPDIKTVTQKEAHEILNTALKSHPDFTDDMHFGAIVTQEDKHALLANPLGDKATAIYRDVFEAHITRWAIVE